MLKILEKHLTLRLLILNLIKLTMKEFWDDEIVANNNFLWSFYFVVKTSIVV